MSFEWLSPPDLRLHPHMVWSVEKDLWQLIQFRGHLETVIFESNSPGVISCAQHELIDARDLHRRLTS